MNPAKSPAEILRRFDSLSADRARLVAFESEMRERAAQQTAALDLGDDKAVLALVATRARLGIVPDRLEYLDQQIAEMNQPLTAAGDETRNELARLLRGQLEKLTAETVQRIRPDYENEEQALDAAKRTAKVMDLEAKLFNIDPSAYLLAPSDRLRGLLAKLAKAN